MFHAELEIFLVLFREGGHAHGNARQIDALVLAQHAAVDHFALDFFARDLEDAQFDEAVGEQNARTRLQVLRQSGKGGGDHSRSAEDVARRNGQPLTGFQLNGNTVLKAAGADLRSLKIAEDTDVFAFVASDFANHFDEL